MTLNSPAKFNRQNLKNLLLAAAMFFMVTGCVLQSSKLENANKPTVEPLANTAETPNITSAKNDDSNTNAKQTDKGDFVVQHLEVKNSRYAEISRKVKEEKLVEKAADTLNRSLILPHDIFLRTKDCGETNALYDPADRSITICYELMEHFHKLFRSDGSSEEESDRKMFDATRFAFLHELGHALIDGYKLPLTGSEEDAADRLSSYICLEEMGEDGVRAVLAMADAFHIEAKQDASNGQKDYSDEHLLQEQRFYNTLCMIYGSDTAKYEYFVKQKYLPEARAERCPNEYERMAQSWSELLQKWRKD